MVLIHPRKTLLKPIILVVLLVALLSSVSYRVHACQPEFFPNYILEMEDGEHVFAMIAFPDTGFEYPQSGLYRKGPEKQLVWSYDSLYIKQGVLENSISYDGRYLVLMHYPGRKQDTFMSIFENGNIIHEIERQSFVDDDTQIFRSICSNPIWGKNIRYDKLNEVFSVETGAKRVVSIHVPSGDVIEINRPLLARADGMVTTKEGATYLVRGIHDCTYGKKGKSMDHLRKKDGITDAPFIFVHESEHGTEKTLYPTVFLDDIKSMSFSYNNDFNYFPVDIGLHDGTSQRWFLSKNSDFCGRSENGDQVTFKADEIERYDFLGTQTEYLYPN